LSSIISERNQPGVIATAEASCGSSSWPWENASRHPGRAARSACSGRGSTCEYLAAPDVVDQHVDVAVLVPDTLAQPSHLIGVEVVDLDRDTGPAEAGDQLGGLLDGLGAVVVRPDGDPVPTT